MIRTSKFAALIAAGVLSVAASASFATLVPLGPNTFKFNSAAPVITFDDTPDVPLGSFDPTYSFSSVPGVGAVDVSFGGSFLGQVASDQNTPPVTLSPSAPTGPLTLDPNDIPVFTTEDPASPTSPVLSGTPLFQGSISIFFDSPVAGFGFTAGSFSLPESTTIQAYGADGSVLGTITNSSTGFQFLGMADSNLADVISGVSIFTSTDSFEIDNVTLGGQGALIPIPLPSSLDMGLAALVIGAFSIAVRRYFVRPTA